jgi:hypothetical protein
MTSGYILLGKSSFFQFRRNAVFPHFNSCFMKVVLSGDMAGSGIRFACVSEGSVWKFNIQICECSGIKYANTGKCYVISRCIALGYEVGGACVRQNLYLK